MIRNYSRIRNYSEMYIPMKELAFLASKEEGTNYGGVEMMIRLKAWVYRYKKNCARTW